MQNPVRGFLHGSAALAALIGSGALILRATSLSQRLALAVFGFGLVALFTTSSLYHSIPWRPVWKKRMQRLDHAMIFVLIAGTYTPLAGIVLDGPLRVATLVVAWGIAGAGIVQQAFFPREYNDLSIVMHVTQGWLALLILGPLIERIGVTPVLLIGLGGVLYTVGMVALVTGRPRLWPRVFSHHEVFHVLVVAAAAIHFVVAYRFVAAYAA